MNMTVKQNDNKKDTAFSFGDIYFWCHIIPLVTTLCWAIYAIPGIPDWMCSYILFPLMCIGWLATLIARPGVILGLAVKLISSGFSAGLMFPLFPLNLAVALFCGCLGLLGFALLVGLAPAVVTIYYLLAE